MNESRSLSHRLLLGIFLLRAVKSPKWSERMKETLTPVTVYTLYQVHLFASERDPGWVGGGWVGRHNFFHKGSLRLQQKAPPPPRSDRCTERRSDGSSCTSGSCWIMTHRQSQRTSTSVARSRTSCCASSGRLDVSSVIVRAIGRIKPGR